MDALHRVLANTWAVVVLLLGFAGCITVLLVTKTITVDQTTGLLIALGSLFSGAGVAWMRGTKPPTDPPAPMLPLLLLAFALGLPGCAGSLQEQRAAGAKQRELAAKADPAGRDTRCAALDDRRAFFGGAGKSLALLGGGAGLATIPVEDDKLETGLAIGAAVSAALAAGAVYVSEQSGDQWVRECE